MSNLDAIGIMVFCFLTAIAVGFCPLLKFGRWQDEYLAGTSIWNRFLKKSYQSLILGSLPLFMAGHLVTHYVGLLSPAAKICLELAMVAVLLSVVCSTVYWIVFIGKNRMSQYRNWWGTLTLIAFAGGPVGAIWMLFSLLQPMYFEPDALSSIKNLWYNCAFVGLAAFILCGLSCMVLVIVQAVRRIPDEEEA